MNDRMTLETTLLLEDSSISQSGTLANSRDFFLPPQGGLSIRYHTKHSIQRHRAENSESA